jgi:single-stranded-DNA-specific exonuclease
MSEWKVYPKIKDSEKLLYTKHDINAMNSIIFQILKNRGIEPQDIEEFLFNEEGQDPFLFTSMKKVVTRIKKAVKNNEKILIYGDYDVDGIAAVSILWDYIYNKMKGNVSPFIPSRFTDGYGLSKKQIEKAKKDGVSLIITVDCGIKDVDNAKLAKDLGIDLIITDHHLKGEILPDAFAIIHPRMGYNFPDLCGAAVAMKITDALSFGTNFDTSEYLDLAALATVCDVSNLTGENRSIVKRGLRVINSRKRQGLDALTQVYKIQNIEVYHLGYILGPKINATGRLYDALDGLRLLNTKDKNSASQLALKLHNMNIERQKLTFEGLESARLQISSEDNFNVLFSDSWNQGIVGLIAGRVTEETGKPTLALTLKSDDLYVGSGRSIDGFNIVESLDSVSEYLEGYGGHAAACGLKVRKNNIPHIKKQLDEFAKAQFKGKILGKTIKIDDTIKLSDINEALFHDVQQLYPFGRANPTPIFLIQGVQVLSAFNIGASPKFVKMKLTDSDTHHIFDAIWFDSVYTPADIIKFSYLDVVFAIEDNVWENKHNLQLKIVDLRPKVIN